MNNLVRSYSHMHLETLPAEIRIQILLLLNVEGLRSLVQASPVYHDQYLLDRKRLLLNCLATTLGRIFFEACIVQETSSVSFSQTRNHDRILEYFRSLTERRCHSDLTAGLTLKDAIDMVTFYLSVLKPFAQHYSVWALGNLAQEPEATHTKIDEALSESEEHRIIRALYRFQLCSNVFGVGPNKDELDIFKIKFQLSDSEILKLLEYLWEPWELEEINCINVFAETKCREIHDAVTWDFSEKNPRFDDQERPPTPDGAVDIPQHSHAYLIGTITQGLERLHTIFFKVQEHSDLVNVMEQTLVLWLEEFLEGDVHGAFTHAAQSGRRARAPSERDKKEERREPLPFRGDRVDDYYYYYSNGAHPPLAWSLLWKGTYSNMLGSYIPDEFHRWGYVMWDAARLERTGAKEVLARGWDLMWGEDEDARDQRDFF